jgi:hypothetical protein
MDPKQPLTRRALVLALSASLFAATAGCGSDKPKESASADLPSGEPMRISRSEVLIEGPVPHAISRTEGGWKFSSSQQWGFGAFAPFDGFGVPRVKGNAEVQLHVTSGQVGVSLLTDRNAVVQEKIVTVPQGDQKVTLDLGSASFDSIVFRSAAPSGTTSEALIQSVDFILRTSPVPGAVSLGQIARVDAAATIEMGPPVRVVSGHKYGFAAVLPVALPSLPSGSAFVRVRARVIRGSMGIAILDKSGAVSKNERFYGATPAAMSYYVVIPNAGDGNSVLFRSDRDERSEMVIEDVAVFRLM